MIDGLSWYLEAAGFVVSSATHRPGSVEKICRGTTQVVILDIMMPEVDGVTVCETIRHAIRCLYYDALGAYRGDR